MATKITQEQLMLRLRYIPETGACLWVSGRNRGASAGWMDSAGYLRTKILGVTYQLSNLIWLYMTGDYPTWEIDHINGKPADNSWNNLRDVPHWVNSKNQKQKSNNTSGVTGVCWHSANKNWTAHITVDGTRIFLGSFSSLEEATVVRKVAEISGNFHQNHGRVA